MSLQFSTILDKIDDNCGTNSTTYTTAKKVVDINLGIDNLLLMLFGQGAGGTWQLDDYNQVDFPIITTNLVSGQRDYSFVDDETGNIILDIYKVQVMGNDGVYRDVLPVDQQGENTPASMTNGLNATGTPTRYDKTGNTIFLDLIPNYDKADGLRVFINRESTYFTVSDTTKKWGYTGLYHEYLVLYPSYQYARAKSLINRDIFKRDLLELEQKIAREQGQRQRDVKSRMVVRLESNK